MRLRNFWAPNQYGQYKGSENWPTEMLPKTVSTKTVVQNVRTKMLAEEFRKNYHFNNHSELLPKTFFPAQTVVQNFCLYGQMVLLNGFSESVRENYQ